ncbi:hypothetical protein [Ornithinimicrobium kibberense]|uniref:hypothetical protein n=1 Tax=Ornithinimicrobium kibberense TaxID=282060 RepID=UPI003618BE03
MARGVEQRADPTAAGDVHAQDRQRGVRRRGAPARAPRGHRRRRRPGPRGGTAPGLLTPGLRAALAGQLLPPLRQTHEDTIGAGRSAAVAGRQQLHGPPVAVDASARHDRLGDR